MNAQDLKNSILQLVVQGKLVEQRAEEGTARELLEQIKLEKDQLIKDKKIKEFIQDCPSMAFRVPLYCVLLSSIPNSFFTNERGTLFDKKNAVKIFVDFYSILAIIKDEI